MGISGYIFASIVLIKIIKSFFDGLENVNAPVSDKAKVRKKLPIKYISNGIEVNKTIRRHYYKVLDIHSSPIINIDVVFEKY